MLAAGDASLDPEAHGRALARCCVGAPENFASRLAEAAAEDLKQAIIESGGHADDAQQSAAILRHAARSEFQRLRQAVIPPPRAAASPKDTGRLIAQWFAGTTEALFMRVLCGISSDLQQALIGWGNDHHTAVLLVSIMQLSAVEERRKPAHTGSAGCSIH
jgi:hypothetical protein